MPRESAACMLRFAAWRAPSRKSSPDTLTWSSPVSPPRRTVDGGTLLGVAVSGDQRSPLLPQVPTTFAEACLPA
jgi:hypothetical protein